MADTKTSTEVPPQEAAAAEAAPVNSPDAEVLEEEPRNLLLALVSQIRIGMDLSRLPLPTFVLEPRSMLERLTDFMTHGELLALVPKIEDPVDRIVGIVKWYLSGFYIKPQGVKKPYNPILGEIFRCKWQHEDGTTSYYIGEQVSHHPPISSFYISNRKAGFVINGSLHPRSKFLGASVASYLDGTAILTLIATGESYSITFPSAYGRGILFGTLLMELVGDVIIESKDTLCKAEIEFKAKPFFGGEYNQISAKIKKKKDTLYTVQGKWDGKLDITNSKTKQSEVLWDSKNAKRVPKAVRPLEQQQDNESQRLWSNVTNAIKKRDQNEATAEKGKLEDKQREEKKDRGERGEDWVPTLFKKNSKGEWIYKYINLSPYSPGEENDEEEDGGVIFSTGRGKQWTLDNADRNFAQWAEFQIEKEKDLKKSSKGVEKPTRSFSTNFLKSSSGSASGDEKKK